MAKKKSTPKINAGNFTSDSEAKISNAKGKWGLVKKLAKKVQEKAKTLSYDELKDLAREYNAKLPKGSKKRISLRQSGEKIAAALGIKPAQEKKSKPQPTEKKPPAKTGEAWGKTLDKVGQGETKPKLSGEAKGDFRKQVKEAAKKLVADKPKVEIEKPAPKETIDGLVKVVEAKKKEIKSKDGKDKSTPEGYTKSELYNLAKDAKVPGYTKMNKQQLFDSLGIGNKKEEKTSQPAEVKKPEPKKEEKVLKSSESTEKAKESVQPENNRSKKDSPDRKSENKKNQIAINVESYLPPPVDWKEERRKHDIATQGMTRDEKDDAWNEVMIRTNKLEREWLDKNEEIRKRNYTPILEMGKKETQKLLDQLQGVTNTEQREKILSDYRKKLVDDSPITEKQAQDFVANLDIKPLMDKEWGKNLSTYREKHLRRDLAELHRMTGGQIKTLKVVKPTPGRPGASEDGQFIMLNPKLSDVNTRNVVFHEFAHHFEYSLPPELRDLSHEFLQQRKTGDPMPLSDLVSDSTKDNYGFGERAYPDKFVHPYVGKVYSDGFYPGITKSEVMSMGIQHFSSPQEMAKLLDKDPEHFALMLGLMQASKQPKT